MNPFRNSSGNCSSFQEGLRVWARQLEGGVCLLNGRKLAEDCELAGGQVVNIKEFHLYICARFGRLARGHCGSNAANRSSERCRSLL